MAYVVRIVALCSALFLFRSEPFAQSDLEDVIVETYYISDANDATDTIGGGVPVGSRTYRVYLDLCTDCALRSVYGDINHALLIQSTAPIFNHNDRGKTFGHELSNSALDEGTVALDSYLSLGAGSNQKAGVLKDEDTDGSIVGGSNNDGGSAQIAQGLLINSDPGMGLPLTTHDGLSPAGGSPVVPPNFNATGDSPNAAFRDSTLTDHFLSDSTRIGCSSPGVKGPTAENKVLVAQITTTGDLNFKLNIEIEKPGGQVVRYVSSDSVLLPGETPNGLLSYPPECGCTDPNFLEYDPGAGCDDGSCQTTIVFGCLDTLACNYDPLANFNVVQLCCYGPGNCNGLDISLVCPDVLVAEQSTSVAVFVHPNPVQDQLTIEMGSASDGAGEFTVRDALGRIVLQGPMRSGTAQHVIDLSLLPSGGYFLHLSNASGTVASKRLIKL